MVRQFNGPLIAYTMSRGGSGFDQIYLLDPETGESRMLTDGESLNNRMIWDRTGQRLAYRSTRRNGTSNDIWMMDIDDPENAWLVLAAPDGALWKPVDITADGKRMLVQHYAGITDSRIYLLDLESGDLRLLVGDPAAPSGNVASGFDANGEGVHFVTNQRNRAAEIGWIPLAPDGVIHYVRSNIPWDVTEFELSPDAKRGAFVTNEEGISRLYLFDPEKGRYKQVKRTPFGLITGLMFSQDGRHLGMTISTSRNPADAFVLPLRRWALGYQRLDRWTYGEVGGLNPEKFARPELIHYPAPILTREGELQMPAFVYRPKARRPFPVVIFIHGGPEGQFRPSFNSTIQMWVDRLGVAVIAPNVRGSMGYGLGYLAMDDARLRENSVMDIGALLDWIADHREFDASRVAVYGNSYGGYMALASVVHFDDRIRAAVDRSGISNFVTYLENTQGYRRDLRRIEYGDERIPEMREFLQRISPLNNVDKISTPLLIVQGQNDPVVPASESEQMVEALRERGQSVWYMNALNEGHGYEKKENR
ncbi:MAG: alpha/beta fold hydrolase, partial [Xanthomonadales bacterium]|nr:S9 family peptidase [Xanthomonadales bacterium]NIX14074.1 alpha/beta fold hydrolase [Xanthomonadales bacterium]